MRNGGGGAQNGKRRLLSPNRGFAAGEICRKHCNPEHKKDFSTPRSCSDFGLQCHGAFFHRSK